jgi:hypothetical protein
MKLSSLLFGFVLAALSAPALATPVNILPGSGASVTGSSLYPGFNAAVAAGNLINGTSNAAYINGDPRWVFADGRSSVQTLIVDLGLSKTFGSVGFSYSGIDRIPTSLSILTSTDGITFNPLAGPSLTTFPADYGLPIIYTRGLSFPPTSAQFVEFDFGADSFGGLCPGCGGGSGQGAGIVQLFVNTQAVPEPMTLCLFGAGFAGMAALRRRKKKAA